MNYYSSLRLITGKQKLTEENKSCVKKKKWQELKMDKQKNSHVIIKPIPIMSQALKEAMYWKKTCTCFNVFIWIRAFNPIYILQACNVLMYHWLFKYL